MKRAFFYEQKKTPFSGVGHGWYKGEEDNVGNMTNLYVYGIDPADPNRLVSQWVSRSSPPIFSADWQDIGHWTLRVYIAGHLVGESEPVRVNVLGATPPRPEPPTVTIPAPTPELARTSSGRSVSSPAPGTAAHSFSTGMSSANRAASNVRRTASNATTADSIIQSIREGLPSGVTAEWSLHSPFTIVPATDDASGRITGIVIITGNNHYRSAINFNIEIPVLENN